MLKAGDIVGGIYQVIREIGHGGTGVVYLAYHLNLRKYIVLKRITKQISSMENLRREADILKQLRHTNIPQIYDFVIENGEVFTVMDYIEGTSLKEYIRGANCCSEDLLLGWLRDLTDVLVYLGSRKPPVIHSDIKPENIIITPQGVPVLIDFNISIAQDAGSKVAGMTRNYASPEQGYIASETMAGRDPGMKIDTRSDIYSLGAVFYSLMTGAVPDCRYMLPQMEHMQGLIYSQAFRSVIDRCIAWDREKRFRNAGKLSAAVNNLYRMDKNYRKYTAMRVVSWIVSAAVFAGGCYCTIHGIQLNNRDHVAELMRKTATATQMGDFASAGENANEILERSGYRRQLDDNQLAQMHHVLADSEYVAGNYNMAATYYLSAANILARTGSAELPSYQSDLALAYLRSGDMEALAELEDQCKAAGTENDDMLLIRAAAAGQNGNKEECIRLAENILKNGSDSTVIAKACVIAAQCYGEDEIKNRLRYMRKAVEYTDELRYIRECAALEYQYAGSPGVADYDRKASAERAARLYEQLCRVPSPQLIDRINLGISYYYSGQNEKALNALSAAAAESDDYRIKMYMAFVAEEMGDKDSARIYCSDAMSACKKDQRQGWEEDFKALKELSDRLY